MTLQQALQLANAFRQAYAREVAKAKRWGREVLRQQAQGGLSGFAGSWEDYCDQNYTDPDVIAKCKKCPKAILGNCISPPPWTEVGAAMRGIPKAHGDISALAQVAAAVVNEMPSIDDYAPPNFLVIAWTDQIKFNLDCLAPRYFPALAAFGNAYCSFFSPDSPVQLIGFGMALATLGGDIQKFWDQCALPILEEIGDRGQVFIDFVTTKGLVGAVTAYSIKKLIKHGISDPVLLAILKAILANEGTVMDAISDPKRFAQAFLWKAIGSSLHTIGDALMKSDTGAAAKVYDVADVMLGPISAVLNIYNGYAAGTRPEVIKATVLDDMCQAVTGQKWSVLQKIPRTAWKSALTVDLGMARLFGNLVSILSGVMDACQQIGLTHVVKGLQATFDDFTALVDALNQVMTQINAANPDVPKKDSSSNPTTATPGGGGPAVAGPAKAQPPAQGGSVLGAAIAGGLPGLVIGGPIGAAIGAGGGMLLLGKKAKK